MSGPLTPEALIFGPVVPADPRISPDGAQIVYSLTTTDRATKRASSQLWLRDVDGANPRRLTAGGERNRDACWSPDGRCIAFVSDRAPKNGLFVLPIAQPGEAQEILRDSREIGDIAWSPDGRRIAYVVAVDPDNPDETEPPSGAAPSVRVTRRLDYKTDGPGFRGDRRRQIFVAEVAGGERRQLTTQSVDHNLPQWSPDGRWLAAQVAQRSGQRSQLGLIDAATGQTQLVGPDQGVVGAWAWSPSGDRILFAGDTTSTGQLDLFVYQVATGQIRRLTDDLPCLPDAGRTGQAPPAPPVWLDERRVLFHAFQAGASGLHIVDTETGRIEPVQSWPALHAGLSLDAARRVVVQTRTSLETPGELIVFDRERGSQRVITSYNDVLLRERPPARWERFETRRGAFTVEAWLLTPPDFDAARRYPVILDVHGGPQSFAGYGFDPVQQLLATHGFLVVFCNPRGSTTYGREFTMQVRQDWGGEDYHDLMAALDAVLERPYADTERVGIYGSSYGGYMTAWAITQTDRFKAAVSRAPVFDLESFYGTSDIGYAWSDLQFGGPPHERREWYAAHSPSTFAHQARTPTLILHGETDDRCPIGQGEQMFVALKQAGCEAEFVRYPGGSHLFFRSSGLPEHRLDFLGRILDWFTRCLGEPAHA